MLIKDQQWRFPPLTTLSSLTRLTTLAMVILAASTCPQALAGGFQLNEYSSAGLGRSYAGEGAVADSIDSASRNPATIMRFNRAGVSVGAVFIDPNIDISGHSSSGDSLNASNVAPSAWVPNLHVLAPINQRFGLSFSVNSNYGLGTQYDPGYLAGEIAGTTSLTSINTNISGAYRISPHWSVGLGVDAVYAQAKIDRFSGLHTTNALAQFGIPFPPGVSVAHMKGDGWGYGWNAGVLYQLNDDNRYALTYRSEVTVKFHGNYSSKLPAALNAVPHDAADQPHATDGKNIAGRLTMNLPEIWELSGYNKVAAQWAVHYSLMYTSWHQFRQLQANNTQGQTLFYRQENFHDAWRVALGSSYFMNKNWTLRAGVAFDQSPIPAAYRSISIPDQNRIWLSAGASYAFNEDASVDVGLSWMHGQALNINDKPYDNLHSHATAWLYGVNFNYLF